MRDENYIRPTIYISSIYKMLVKKSELELYTLSSFYSTNYYFNCSKYG